MLSKAREIGQPQLDPESLASKRVRQTRTWRIATSHAAAVALATFNENSTALLVSQISANKHSVKIFT
jgi:hypothetical protein